MGNFTIAICGGGIGGLSLAVILKKYLTSDWLNIDLYEAGPKFTEIGAGITAWERTRSIFRTLGMWERLDTHVVNPSVRFRKSDTKPQCTFHDLRVPHGQTGLTRLSLLNLLLECLAPDSTSFLTTHFSKKLVSYEQDADGVTLSFADGTTARADLLVGAEGLASPTRKKMYADMASKVQESDPQEAERLLKVAQISWTGTYAYRTMLDRGKLRARAPNSLMLDTTFIWCGEDKHVVSYPISPTLINVLYFDTVPAGLGKILTGPSVAPASKDEILALYKDWEEDISVSAEIIEDMTKWAISQIRGLPHYVDGRVALLGDSAHAMTTHFGAGAGQAVEDAYILGRLLAHPRVHDASTARAALGVYDAVRQPIGSDAVERSLRLGFLYEFQAAYLPADVDRARACASDVAELARLGAAISEVYEFHWAAMPEQDWERAQGLLEAGLARERV
ncbi:hypothetical protein PHLGIDRAFT_183112 [Phlebiopsis gigantea 11061_1 CR5-6]|uniref:FAD-binding domain-containing protein n=1 Tax=Phlebiopsis gigantea (strain 11061_1 CR5-6) TaxID=745531 RepID=A0A0C3PG37_PHLG1|nr:hypothetical protein PHLGIDRAFT_183112 [Phlebiopsis gigantea 11061_1 CR5-6]